MFIGWWTNEEDLTISILLTMLLGSIFGLIVFGLVIFGLILDHGDTVIWRRDKE